VKVFILGFFVATMAKLQQFVINELDKVRYQGSYSASLLAPLTLTLTLAQAHFCTHGTL